MPAARADGRRGREAQAAVYARRREKMVQTQIIDRGITAQRVVDAMRAVPRHEFVPAEEREYAYDDRPLPVGYAQTISQPYIVAFMIDAARIPLHGSVLEIGTGCGYQAAVLAEVARDVFSVEIVPELARRASENLQRLGYGRVQVKQSDGYAGWPEHAPYDGILVAAAPVEPPKSLLEQLKVGAKLVIPIGREDQELIVITRRESGYTYETAMPVRFVPMTGYAEAV